MSIKIMSAVWGISLRPSTKLVLLCLADIADDDGVCWPHQDTIAQKTCLSIRAVRDCIRTLEEAGYIETEPKVYGGLKRGLVYQIRPSGKICRMDDHSADSAGAIRQILPVPFGKSCRSITSKEPSIEPSIGNIPPTPASCPVEAIVLLWNDLMTGPAVGLHRIGSIGPSLRGAIIARWTEDPSRQGLSWWRTYFVDQVAGSDFLSGKVKDWAAGLDWVVDPKNMGKIINGAFTNKGGKGDGNSRRRKTNRGNGRADGSAGGERVWDGVIPSFDEV
jgi:hypothetical protein